MAGHPVQHGLTDHFKTRQRRAQALPRQRKKGQCRVDGRKADERTALPARQWIQLERGRGDDTQRALAADIQVPQRIAGVVLAQRAQLRQHAAVGQHHLQA
ncbi:hypothetical protein G6F24_018546 [Rhizopus arrhizus]|nr:hypothetical protein G6F24_018546 [Rhizopus arrhizus]